MNIRGFRVIAILEGMSLLILLLIAMPLKYLVGIPEAVKITGWLHGLLFMLYIPSVFLVRKKLGWNLWHVLIALIASVIPAGTFVLDRKLISRSKA